MSHHPNLADRDLELRVKGHLYEIRRINDDIIESRQGLPMALAGYNATLQNVADCSNAEIVDEVANHIKDSIKENNDRPANRKVRRFARSKVTEAGYPSTSYLNSA